jgi:hypothetical protein
MCDERFEIRSDLQCREVGGQKEERGKEMKGN